MRINSAADDAAGLAMAGGLQADRRVQLQAIRNVNDSISLLNIAEGALGSLSSATIRLRELASQAANGTLSDVQRRSLNAEADALVAEVYRVVQSTEFNNRKLLDGQFGTLLTQAGYGEENQIPFSFGSTITDWTVTAGDGTFMSPVSYDVVGKTWDITLADLNADGSPDILANADGQGQIGVLMNDGSGNFSAPTYFDVGPEATFTASAIALDFNGDGKLDLAVTSHTTAPQVAIMLGNGDGTFGQAEMFDLGGNPSYGGETLAAADVNNDGNLDLLISKGFDTDPVLLLGNGDGTFQGAQFIPTSGSGYLYNIQTGDFNGDGEVDLAVGQSEGLRILYGQGDGTFTGELFLDGADDPRSIAVADVDGDGVSDLITASSHDEEFNVYLGNGDGSFQAKSAYTVGGSTDEVATADVNGDGILDVIAGESTNNKVHVFIGNGDGTFQARQSYDHGTGGIAVGDLNGDGALDIVTNTYDDGYVNVLFGNTVTTDGSFDIDLSTRSDALDAIEELDELLVRISRQRGAIGAMQSRFSSTLNHLRSSTENLAEAESRIMDVDVAEEAARLVRLSILQQAGVAVLSQANQIPQLALRLLDVD